LSIEYERRAGWIGVNGNIGIASSRFGHFREQDFANPSMSLEFTKQSGRTTGSLTLNAARESRADAAVNLRSSSWNYGTELSYKYPIVGAYTLAGQFGYGLRKYTNEAVFANLGTFTAGVNLLKILSTERELMAGYRYRYSQ